MRKLTLTIAAVALSLAYSMSAQAASLVAGWDFSQYYADSVHSIDGGNSAAPSDIRANYSSFDPNGAGAQAAAFGVYHLPFTPVGDASEPLLPTAVPGTGSLLPNINQGPYNNFSVLTLEGQASQSDLAMVAVQTTSLVFEADLTTVPQTGSDWQITLAGATQLGTGTIQIEFSTNGSAWSQAGTISVSTSAIALSSTVQAVTSDRAFFRLTLSPSTVIDNVGITANLVTVPEPSTAALLAAGLLGLGRIGRRRRA
ncbi:MAG TPA: PEP-CTERM sorting domain-containing protein [Myxococcota bacterium]